MSPELDLVDRVVVAEGQPEVVQTLLVDQAVEVVPDPVPHHPPGHRDQPQHDEDHRHDVEHEVAAELAETAHHLVAVFLLDAPATLGDGDADEKNQADADTADDEEPGEVGLGRTVGVLLARLLGVKGPDDDHEDEDGEDDHVEDADTPQLSLLPVGKETFTALA